VENFYSSENPKLAYLCDTEPACDQKMSVPCCSVTGRFHIIIIIIIIIIITTTITIIIIIIITIIISVVVDLFLLPLRNYYFKGEVPLVN
jgi:hypothetical protein